MVVFFSCRSISVLYRIFNGGGENDASRATPPRGVWGILSQEILKFTCSEVASGVPKNAAN